jgi:holliday junction DNA helicase RuvA
MISYLEGRLKSTYGETLTLFVAGIGYEILVPAYVMKEIKRLTSTGDELQLYISYNQTERQPKPVLVGFRNELDKEFFELFISVEDIGPSAAVKALVKPVSVVARSIEDGDARALRELKGIGERKAQKIIATLRGKVAKYALIPEVKLPTEVAEDFKKEVEAVLMTQLGHKVADARKMIDEAIARNPRINSSEELFEEVYRGQKG